MNSAECLRVHRVIFQTFGLWTEKKTLINFQIIMFYTTAIGFILTIITSIFFVESMKQVVDNLMVMNSSVLVVLKSIIFALKYSQHIKMFALIEKLDKEINVKSFAEIAIIKKVTSKVSLLFRAFAACYAFAWIVLAIQSIFQSSDKVFWSSIALYPGEISQIRVLYWIVLIFQAFANLILVVLTFACDTYGIVVIMILSGFIEVLVSRLSNLGNKVDKAEAKIEEKKCTTRPIDASLDLKECIKRFYSCLE